jgi:uncharacterized protein YtpQ (UPF0354 family)
MWVWVTAGWFAIAAGLAWLHHRLHRAAGDLPEEVEAFLVQFENRLTALFPEIQYLGLLPGQFTALLRVRGQDTPVAMHEPFRRAQAFPHAFDAMVEHLVADVEELGLDRVTDHDFAGVATWIMPQLRSREWLTQQGQFGDSGLVHRLLNQELAVVYVIDDPHSMVFVCRAHLRRWHKTEADLHNLAVANLQRLGDAGLQKAGQEPLLLRTGDGYDAARLLLLDSNVEGLLVAVPERDTLWVAPESGQDLATLMATTEELTRKSPHPISGSLYRVNHGQFETVRS